MSWFRKNIHWDSLSKDQKRELRLSYQRVFNIDDADVVLVLQHMLSELHHFRESENEEDVVLQNYAKRLLRNIGVWRDGGAKNIVSSYIYNSRIGAFDDIQEI